MKEVWNNKQIPNLVTINQILKKQDNKTYFKESQHFKKLKQAIQTQANL